MTIDTLTTFFGWLAVINIGYLMVATLGIVGMQSWMASIHQRLFGLEEKELKRAYFNWLATYKTLTLIFTVAPYIALKLI
ncbi:DUF6868 family protein [Sedimentitalea todarodis]|uniref:DUF6868 domain-containing protein n=1 Tax=Sedimentitalea todarodis TaxID=1631240 RepID=A0ABU3VG69_9RHOB|nr:hypothetical protein [Sedimentitalea todarodis]MDU9005160.1 hypothetical protein [Sedimentitalea todarodis]